MVTDICLKYVLSYRIYASWSGCIIIRFLHCMITLCLRWNILALELYQLLQYSYVFSSVMSVLLEGGGSTRDARVSLTNVDVVSRLDKYCRMSPFPMDWEVASRWWQPCPSPINPPHSDWGVGGTKSRMVGWASLVNYRVVSLFY